MTNQQLETLRANCWHIADLINRPEAYSATGAIAELHRTIKELPAVEQKQIFRMIQDSLDIYVP